MFFQYFALFYKYNKNVISLYLFTQELITNVTENQGFDSSFKVEEFNGYILLQLSIVK